VQQRRPLGQQAEVIAKMDMSTPPPTHDRDPLIEGEKTAGPGQAILPGRIETSSLTAARACQTVQRDAKTGTSRILPPWVTRKQKTLLQHAQQASIPSSMDLALADQHAVGAAAESHRAFAAPSKVARKRRKRKCGRTEEEESDIVARIHRAMQAEHDAKKFKR
jgi:hypothetical protein